MTDETPLRRRVNELEAQLRQTREAAQKERSELEAKILAAHGDALSASDSALDLEETTYALVAQLRKEQRELAAETRGLFADAEARAIRRMRRGRQLARRASTEARAFWAAVAVVAIVGVLVGVGRVAPEAFVTTAGGLILGVAGLVYHNRSRTRKEDHEEDARGEEESLAPPPPSDPSEPPPPRRRRRR